MYTKVIAILDYFFDEEQFCGYSALSDTISG